MVRKELKDMTLEELWELFPVFLVEPNKAWEENYREEEKRIKDILSDFDVKRVSHIGSTAVKDIWAKNIVDILAEAAPCVDLYAVAEKLENNGYIVMNVSPGRISLNRGYTADGFADKVYHLHLRYEGDNDELYFRDYLNAHPDVAKEYEKLKLTLWKRFEHDRDGYTNAKTDFIRAATEQAKQEFGKRY